MEQAWKMQKNSLYCNARLRNKKEKMKRKKKEAEKKLKTYDIKSNM